MMDALLQFASAQAITVSAISNVIDTAADVTLKNEGGRGSVFVVARVGTAFTAAGAGTLEVQLVSDSTANLATAPVIHVSSGAIPKATLVANKTVWMSQLPYGDYKRYVGINYVVASGPMTAGTIDTWLTNLPQFWRAMQAINPVAR